MSPDFPMARRTGGPATGAARATMICVMRRTTRVLVRGRIRGRARRARRHEKGLPTMAQVRSIGSLTALRFGAAFLILIEHSRGTLLPTTLYARYPLDAGVTFFYVLSGFILAYVHPGLRGREGRRAFYVARFARIWPGIMLSLIFVLLLLPSLMYFPSAMLWHGPGYYGSLLSYVTMTQAWVPVPVVYFGFNGVAWSVSVEAFFYLMFPFLLLNFERTWRRKAVLVALAGLGLIFIGKLLGLPQIDAQHLTTPVSHGLVYINPLSRLKEFFVGIAVGVLFLKVRAQNRTLGLAVGWEAAALFSLFYVVLQIGPYRSRWITQDPDYGMWTDQLLHALLFGLVIFVFAFNRGLISRALSTKFPVLLGEISFSVYLVHQIVLNVYRRNMTASWMPTTHVFPMYVVVVCLVAYLMWRFVEVPSRTAIRRAYASRVKRRKTAEVLGSESVGRHRHPEPAQAGAQVPEPVTD